MLNESRRSVAAGFLLALGFASIFAFQTQIDYITQVRNKPSVSVMDMGAKGNGQADDTAAFNKAVATLRAVNVPCGTYKISAVALKLNSLTNTIGDIIGESAACVKINATSTTAAAFHYDTAGSYYGPRIENMTITYPAGTGAGCIALGDAGQSDIDFVRGTVRNIYCTGPYSNGGSTSIDPNYRTTTVSSASTMRSYGVGLMLIHALDFDVSQNSLLQNGVDIWMEGSDLNRIDTNRSQASGWFLYTVDGSTFGNMNRIVHNDILINGGAGCAIQLNHSYYYQVVGNYYENLYASACFWATSQDSNTYFSNNKYNFTPTSDTTATAMFVMAPQRTDWVTNNIAITNSHAQFSEAQAQCNATNWENSAGSNELGSYLCVWKDNNIGFPVPDQPAVVTHYVDPYTLSYDNPNVLFGGSSSSFPWALSETTGRYVINTANSYNWTIPLNPSKLGFQGSGNGYQFDLRIQGRALTNPSHSFIPIDFTDGSTGTTTRYYQGFVNFTNTTTVETRDILFNLPLTAIPPGSTITLASLPTTSVEIQQIKLVPQQPQATYDAGNVSGTVSLYLSNPAPKWKMTLTGDVTDFSLVDTLDGGTTAYNGKRVTMEVCQDSTGNRRMPLNSWGQTLFMGAQQPVTTASHCTDQSFEWHSSTSKFYAVSNANDVSTFYPNIDNYHWTVTRVDNGTSGCDSDNGCMAWDGFSTGVLPIAASANTSVGLLTMPAKYVVEGVLWSSTTGCSGGSLTGVNLEVGVGDSLAFFAPATSIFAADTRLGTATYSAYNDTTTDGLVLTWVGTGDTLDHMTTCSVDVWAKIEQRQ